MAGLLNCRVTHFQVEKGETKAIKLVYDGDRFYGGVIFCRISSNQDYSIYSLSGYGDGDSRINLNSLCLGINNSVSVSIGSSDSSELLFTNSNATGQANIAVLMISGDVNII